MRAGALGALLLFAGCGTTSTVTAPVRPRADLPALPPVDDDEPPRDVSPEAYRAVLEAELKMQGGDLAGGVALLREAALQDPASSYLRVRLAEACLEGGDVEQAKDAAEEALRLAPKSVAALLVLAHTQRLAGDGEAAERTLARLLAIDAAHRDGSLLLAELRVERGDVRGAEHVIEALMEREPGAVDGYIALARVFAERGDVERAFRHADRALARESDDPDALGLKLTLLFARGDFTAALPVARALAAAAGDGALVRRDLLAAHALAGDLVGADQLAAAWLDDDGSEDMRLLVSSSWERAGELERATRALEPAGGARSPRLAAERGHALLVQRRPGDAADATCPLVGAPATPEVAGYLLESCVRALLRAGRAPDAAARLTPLLASAGAPLLETLAAAAK
ncbi:MAG: tetratricopeptide repeat protein, partial [Deltaproteobacteria bacterium]|nr:tetratricopeptide repeat protein [Deltaproteobacteria bacterium]